MADKKPRATLSDQQARGGVIGGKGYRFQAAYIASRIPVWLADPDFAQFIQEGAGDVDVRFDRTYGERRWYIQIKNHAVRKMREAREVLTQFRDKGMGSPGTYSRFILASPGLHNDLQRVRTAVEEWRGVAPFYRPGQDEILDNTWVDLEGLVEELNLPVDAVFLVDKVYFDTNLTGLTDSDNLRDLFVGRLLRLEVWGGVTPTEAAHAYEKLALLAHQAIRETCSREQVETLIREAVERLQTRLGNVVKRFPPPHIHSNEPASITPEVEQWLRDAGYEYYCFISWAHTMDTDMTMFARKVKEGVEKYLADYVHEPRVFFRETDVTGEARWQELSRALCRSVAMVAICAPVYFHPRRRCGLEWSAMDSLSRLRFPNDDLKAIIPAFFRKRGRLPQAVTMVHPVDFSRVTISGRHYYNTIEFRQKIAQIYERVETIALRTALSGAQMDCEHFRIPTEPAFSDYVDQGQPFPFRR